ncbi:MAG: GIY-YIG nuclease family protein [Patescibacteria group bacterium]
MYYVYILISKKDKRLYIGYTGDLKRRLAEHAKGCVESTKNRRPLEILGYEAYHSKIDAENRERYLKSGGKPSNELKLRYQDSIENILADN